MSYELTNDPSSARRHERSHDSFSSNSSVSETLRDQQKKEFLHLAIGSQPVDRQPSGHPPPNYSIVPSTIHLEGTSIELQMSTFPRFKDFPAEIRINVYKYACLEPRLVPIWPIISNRSATTVSIRFTSETPAIMQVSHEARHESRKLNIYTSPRSPILGPRIWIKPTLDIICPVRNTSIKWNDILLIRFADCLVKNKVERLVLDGFSSSDDLDSWTEIGSFPNWMNQHLREIYHFNSPTEFNIRRQPLKLVKNIDQSYDVEGDTETDMSMTKFSRLHPMMGT